MGTFGNKRCLSRTLLDFRGKLANGLRLQKFNMLFQQSTSLPAAPKPIKNPWFSLPKDTWFFGGGFTFVFMVPLVREGVFAYGCFQGFLVPSQEVLALTEVLGSMIPYRRGKTAGKTRVCFVNIPQIRFWLAKCL